VTGHYFFFAFFLAAFFFAIRASPPFLLRLLQSVFPPLASVTVVPPDRRLARRQ
jgi:hypothetical protein